MMSACRGHDHEVADVLVKRVGGDAEDIGQGNVKKGGDAALP